MAITPEIKKKYSEMASYVGKWGEGLNKTKLVGNIHKNLLGVDRMGRPRPLEDLAFFLLIAKQYGLNPLKNDIYATYQFTKQGGQMVEKLVPIPSIHGLRRLARQAKMPTYAYTGKAIYEYADDAKTKLDSATVEVFGYFSDPNHIQKVGEFTAYMEEFEQHKKDGTTTAQWSKMPRVMLAKCAEANAIRASFGLGGIYVEEEITSDDDKILRLEDREENENVTQESEH